MESNGNIAIYAWDIATSGTNYGVYGRTSSADGYAGYFLGGRNYFSCNVGIGAGAPTFNLEVNGSAGKPGGGSWSNSSDRRLKKNIRDLDSSLDKLMKLRGVRFEYKDPDSINELHGTRIGMIAQEVEKVLPDWVETRKDGYKAVTYRGFVAFPVEALRELRNEKNVEIASLRARMMRCARDLILLKLSSRSFHQLKRKNETTRFLIHPDITNVIRVGILKLVTTEPSWVT